MDNAPDYESGDLGVRVPSGVLKFGKMEEKKKSAKQISKDKKAWLKKGLRVWRRICNHVRIVEDGDNFVVEMRDYLGLTKGYGEWRTVNMYSTLPKALERKHLHIVMVVMRDLGYRYQFVDKRKKRKKRK